MTPVAPSDNRADLVFGIKETNQATKVHALPEQALDAASTCPCQLLGFRRHSPTVPRRRVLQPPHFMVSSWQASYQWPR